MVPEDPVDLNLSLSPSSRKIPALLTKNPAQPCQTESYGEIMWIRVRPTDDDDDDEKYNFRQHKHTKFTQFRGIQISANIHATNRKTFFFNSNNHTCRTDINDSNSLIVEVFILSKNSILFIIIPGGGKSPKILLATFCDTQKIYWSNPKLRQPRR